MIFTTILHEHTLQLIDWCAAIESRACDGHDSDKLVIKCSPLGIYDIGRDSMCNCFVSYLTEYHS